MSYKEIFFNKNDKVKQRSGCYQRFHSNSSEVKQGSKRSQGFFFSSEGKQASEHSQRFDFNCSKVKQHSECKERFHLNKSGKVK